MAGSSPVGSPKSPKTPKSPNPVPAAIPEIDTSIMSWINNIKTVLHYPSTIIIVSLLLISGTFIESASRKSLEILDNVFGRVLSFVLPLFFAYAIDWPTGLLAAAVALILFARLQKDDMQEGFMSQGDSVQTTKIVSNTHRWFVEKVLGEIPIAISSDRIQTKRYDDNDNRTSSSSSMYNSQTSDGTK
jgi:hypothetical protein